MNVVNWTPGCASLWQSGLLMRVPSQTTLSFPTFPLFSLQNSISITTDDRRYLLKIFGVGGLMWDSSCGWILFMRQWDLASVLWRMWKGWGPSSWGPLIIRWTSPSFFIWYLSPLKDRGFPELWGLGPRFLKHSMSHRYRDDEDSIWKKSNRK